MAAAQKVIMPRKPEMREGHICSKLRNIPDWTNAPNIYNEAVDIEFFFDKTPRLQTIGNDCSAI